MLTVLFHGRQTLVRYDERLFVAANEARFVLPPDVRQTVLRMTRAGIRDRQE